MAAQKLHFLCSPSYSNPQILLNSNHEDNHHLITDVLNYYIEYLISYLLNHLCFSQYILPPRYQISVINSADILYNYLRNF